MIQDFKVVIPARFASTRLPGKPLLDIGGKPMVVRVAERAKQSLAQSVVVATDSPEIQAACDEHRIECLLTSSDHPTGTDRLAEVAQLLKRFFITFQFFPFSGLGKLAKSSLLKIAGSIPPTTMKTPTMIAMERAP